VDGFLRYFLAPFDTATVLDFLVLTSPFSSAANAVFWLLMLAVPARFFLPYVILWIVGIGESDRDIEESLPLPSGKLPFISVVIPGRNEAAGIVQTVRSILYAGYSELEVIYVDDGSEDDSVSRLRGFAATLPRAPDGTERLRVFASPRRNGKPTALNIGIHLARGSLIALVDADCDVQYGSFHHWIRPFEDERVGAVAANIRVRNANASLLARLQDCEYAINVTLSRAWRAALDLLAIVPGAGGMFRASIIRKLGGFDTGLGDDTDMTLKLRKAGWKLAFAMRAVVWTDVPTRWRVLLRQRSRWERNMVKIRLRKHRDLISPRRFGWTNTLITVDLILVRIVLPVIAVWEVFAMSLSGPMHTPEILTVLYWLTALGILFKLLIARDVDRTPQPVNLWVVPLMPLFRIVLRVVLLGAIAREWLRIGQRHAYVPMHIWQETPHW
jgi:cellulose synthase/poly-beta-1,6-N-acetylglucosamine synthase-like glycosyltransferase